MSGFFPAITAGGGANQHLDNTFEKLGYNTDGTPTSVAASASSNTKGNWIPIGTTVAEWSALLLNLAGPNPTTANYLLDLSLDGGATTAVSNIFFNVGSGLAENVPVPMDVPAGSDVRVKLQSSSASGSVGVTMTGIVKNSQSEAGFTTATALTTPDTAATRASTTDVTFSGGATPAWQELIHSTSADLDMLQAVLCGSTSAPATAQGITLALAIGASGFEVEFFRQGFSVIASATVSRMRTALIAKHIAAGSRISAAILTATPGSDKLRVGLRSYH